MQGLNLELGKVKHEIMQKKSRRVLIQLPDGLKPKAKEIVDFLQRETSAEILIFAGSCFGACDVPLGLDSLGIDLLVQFGHSRFV
jgi:2-(3-amino-3-carboxypropyl)histidine synthase